MLDGYKIFLVVAIAFIIIIGVFIGLPTTKLFVGIPDYGLYVDPVIDTQYSTIIGQVLIQNTGSQPLTNVKVDFGEGDILYLGTIAVRDRVILTTPTDNKMEFVTVSADQDVFVNKVYREEQLN